MNGALAVILRYLVQSAARTAMQLLLVLGPLLFLAIVLHYLSRYVRARAARLMGLDVYTYFTAPGVMVHELGHAFFCLLFRHKIVRMRLFSPQADGTLGSVDHAYNPKSAYQKIGNFFIGTGPIWFGTAIVFLLSRYLLELPAPLVVGADMADRSTLAAVFPRVMETAWRLLTSIFQSAWVSNWRFWLFGYLVFCIGSHITLSRSDIDGAGRGFAWLILFSLALNLLTLWADAPYLAWACDRLVSGCTVFYAAGLFVVFCNVGLAIAMFFLCAVGKC
ncbi:MAG TPA: hypothetical protein VG326_15870 [Tepidisphaeraceae bacterium]|jgi:hypothetical protein|nr:hypothetical protein [Tepidisphaeraceae bacterium]